MFVQMSTNKLLFAAAVLRSLKSNIVVLSFFPVSFLLLKSHTHKHTDE